MRASVVLNSKDCPGKLWLPDFSHTTHLTKTLSKPDLNALVVL